MSIVFPDEHLWAITFDTARAVSGVYDISDWVDIYPTEINPRAESQVGQMTCSVYQYGQQGTAHEGVILPFTPTAGVEIVFAANNAYGTNLHDYHFTGQIIKQGQTALPSGLGYLLTLESWDRAENGWVSTVTFQGDDNTLPMYALNERARIIDLVEQGGFLQGEWDAHTYAQGPFVDYTGAPPKTYNRTTVFDIIAAEAFNRGASNAVLARRWNVTGRWKYEDRPGSSDNYIVRELRYYAQDTGPQELIPLTDRDDRLANYASDNYDRPDNASSLGTSTTGHVWQYINGAVWAILSGKARHVTGGGVTAALVDAGISDGTVSVTYSTSETEQRLWFRCTTGGTGGIQGWFVQILAGGTYQLQYFNGSGGTPFGAGASPIAANGDVVSVVLAGSSIQVLVNGVVQISTSSASNQTATKHGIGTNNPGGTARFDTFYVQGQGFQYYDWIRTLDYTALINAIPIAGPQSDPFPADWQTSQLLDVAAGQVIKQDVSAWQTAHVYSPGDRVRPRQPNGRHYRANNAGTSHASTEPTWPLTEGSTVNDNGITWVCETWDAYAQSKQQFTDDGGRLYATVQDRTVCSDSYSRADNPITLGKTENGKDYSVYGTNARAGVVGNQGYIAYRESTDAYAVVDCGIGSSVIVQVKLAAFVVGARMVFRASDDANLWFVEALTSSYTINKRQAGSNTVMATVSETPANNDVLKISATEGTIQFYKNNVLKSTLSSQTFNMGATFHGWGKAQTALAARFDDFTVWETYGTKQIGLNLSTLSSDPSSVEYAWRLYGDTRRAYVVDGGVEQSTNWTTVTTGDQFMIEALRWLPNGQQLPRMRIRYYKKASGASSWGTHLYESGTAPTVNEANPMTVVAHVYHVGASVSGVTMQRFTYSIHTDQASIQKYGWFWHKGLFSDDNLDTQQKRIDKANDVFSRYSLPRDTFTCNTVLTYPQLPYRYGRVVLINNSDLGWIDTRQYLVEIDANRSAVRNRRVTDCKLTLGASPWEYGDDEPMGQLLRAQEDDHTAPNPPVGFVATTAQRDGPNSVSQTVTWTRPTGDERWLEYIMHVVGERNPQIRGRFDANIASGQLQRLAPSTMYTIRVRYIDRNGNAGDFAPDYEFTTPRLTGPTPPAWAAIPFPAQGPDGNGKSGWIQAAWIATSPPQGEGVRNGISRYMVRVRPYQTPTGVDETDSQMLKDYRYYTFDGNQTNGVLTALALYVQYSAEICAVDEWGFQGAFGTLQTFTISPTPPIDPPSDFEPPNMATPFGGGAISAAEQVGTPTVDLSTAQQFTGARTLRMVVAAGQTAVWQSHPQAVVGNRAYSLKWAMQDASGSNVRKRVLVRWYDASGAQIGADVSAYNATGGTGAFVETVFRLVSPSNARTARRVLIGDASVSITGTTIYWTLPRLTSALSASELFVQLDPNQLSFDVYDTSSLRALSISADPASGIKMVDITAINNGTTTYGIRITSGFSTDTLTALSSGSGGWELRSSVKFEIFPATIHDSYIEIKNQTAPGTPTSAGRLYVNAGALWYIGSSGTSTKIANA